MSTHKVFMEYDNCYFNDAMQCVFCRNPFESGGIQFGLATWPDRDLPSEVAGGDFKQWMRAASGQQKKIASARAVCPVCMKRGQDAWKAMLREDARKLREIDWKLREQESLQKAAQLESMANDDFILPSE